MNIIESYYYYIIGVGLFIMFALLGYLVELSKKTKEKQKIELNNNISNEVNNNVKINNTIVENKVEQVSINNDIIDKDILNKKE